MGDTIFISSILSVRFYIECFSFLRKAKSQCIYSIFFPPPSSVEEVLILHSCCLGMALCVNCWILQFIFWQQCTSLWRWREQWHTRMRLIVKLRLNFHFFPWTMDTVFHELAFYVLIYSLSCRVIRILDRNYPPLCQTFPQKCTCKVTNDCTVESQLLCSFSSVDLDTQVLPGLINSSIHVVGLNWLY